MQIIHLIPIVALFPFPTLAASDSKPVKPCTIHSPSSGSYYDLTPLSVLPLKDGKKAHKDDRSESWHARGYDYPTNFTLNFCAPVIEDVKNFVGVEKGLWRNVSAFYELGGKTYSIGQQSSEPVFRGRKLVLNYTDGSPCDSSPKPKRDPSPRLIDDDEDDDDDKKHHTKKPQHGSDRHKGGSSSKDPVHRKSTIISLLCDRDPLAPKATVAFVGASPDECAYFFEVRSSAACGGVSDAQQSLGPGGVFGIIALIAVAVYVLGGCAYQRTVMHQRGWRQVPNYSIWAGIASFIRDIFVITTSSLLRLIPKSFNPFRRRQGYTHLSISANGNGPPNNSNGGTFRGGRDSRGNRADDENRLIDQLDEEWGD